MIAWILVIIGGLNWLLVGLFQWDISHVLGGMDSIISRIIFVLVGLSALYELFTHKANCKMCSSSAPMNKPAM
jgi:uncharacterized membrane protein YuzA (DUF378 family)